MKSRRDFLRIAAQSLGVAAGSSMLPASVAKALAIPPYRRTGTIKDVEHVVILMQENRSFDHYFGSLRGVRGFNDPRPLTLANGKPVWYQPTAEIKTSSYHNRGLAENATYVLPFYLDPKRTTEHTKGGDHGWSSGHLSWNHGKYDQWVNQKQDVVTMGYLKREDVSFHYALADAFTVCDSYFCSVHAYTAVNRLYLWSGTCDPRNVYGTRKNGPGMEERHKTNGYSWTTYPERLEKNNISWKVYQGGTGDPGSPTDNFTDNSLEFFAQYQVEENVSPNSPLVTKGVSNYPLSVLREDVIAGRLPQVSWIVAPEKFSEHPEASPGDGAYYINAVLEALTASPEVWSKTVFIINYDENDVFFDHVVPPMPPSTNQQNGEGLVTEDLLESLQDEFLDVDKYPTGQLPLIPGADPGGAQPIGLGPRLPMLIVSPWTRGGWVCSEVFDHTSVLRFLEARFGVYEPNISKWRRSICGDLTSAFDFSSVPDKETCQFAVPQPILTKNELPKVPSVQYMPTQEAGTKPARALPYTIYSDCRVDIIGDKFWIDLVNSGKAGAAFYIYSTRQPQQNPRRYTVSAAHQLSDYWPLSELKAGHKLSVYGPNGYLSEFACDPSSFSRKSAAPEAKLRYDSSTGDLHLTLRNSGSEMCRLQISNVYDADAVHHYSIAPDQVVEDFWKTASSAGWFDLSIRQEFAPGFLRRYAGHVETGISATSDPMVFKKT